MTTRKRFERWARHHGLSLERMQEVTRNGTRWHYIGNAETAWQAWQAATRAKT